MVDDPLNPLDHTFISTNTMMVENTYTDQIDIRGDPAKFAIGIGLAVGNDTGNMRAVAVGVARQ